MREILANLLLQPLEQLIELMENSRVLINSTVFELLHKAF